MAELFYALAVFALGIWLAYNANALGMHTAAWLAGGRIEYGRNSRIVRWHDGTFTLPRLALLYAGGLAGTLVLLLVLAGLMAVIFLL